MEALIFSRSSGASFEIAIAVSFVPSQRPHRRQLLSYHLIEHRLPPQDLPSQQHPLFEFKFVIRSGTFAKRLQVSRTTHS